MKQNFGSKEFDFTRMVTGKSDTEIVIEALISLTILTLFSWGGWLGCYWALTHVTGWTFHIGWFTLAWFFSLFGRASKSNKD